MEVSDMDTTTKFILTLAAVIISSVFFATMVAALLPVNSSWTYTEGPSGTCYEMYKHIYPTGVATAMSPVTSTLCAEGGE